MMENPTMEISDRMRAFTDVIQKWKREELQKIQQKSTDEVEYERNKINREARESFDEDFSRRHKNIEVDAKIKKSRKINEMRLNKMKLMFDIVEKVKEQVLVKVSDISKDEGKYSKLIQDLLIQGLTRMLEPNVEVKCLRKDSEVVKKAITRAQMLFGNMCEVQTELKLSEDYLPDSQIGGVMLTSNKGKIVCNNTLKARSEYAMEIALPNVREMLFPKNK